MTDFEKIKQFFIKHMDRFVCYTIKSKEDSKNTYFSDYERKTIINNNSVKDFFIMEFPSSSQKENLITIDSCDSFVFNIYFADLGDKIIINDAGRTFECGVEAFEGNGVFAKQNDTVLKYLAKFGIEYKDYSLKKQITQDSFINDTINFIRALQTINNAQPYPPYILELDNAKEIVDVLTYTWIKGEKITDGQNSRKLALFDNHKDLEKNFTCPENTYCEHFNKHAFVGIFFNDENKVLICRNLKSHKPQYDFAIHDFVLENEFYSSEALQRAVHNNFGIELWFGEIAPSVTTTKDKIITDYYIIKDYNVTINELTYDKEAIAFDWVTSEELFVLIKSGDFNSYNETFIKYIYEIKENK